NMYYFIKQAINISLGSLLASKARSFLTMLGIIIGVAAVVVIVAVGEGAQFLILSQVKNLGTNLVGVMPGKAEDKSPPVSVMGIVVTTLKYNDLLALKRKNNVPNLVEAAGFLEGVHNVQWKNNSYMTTIKGTTHGYLIVENSELESGRFFTAEEEKNLSRVAVLGSAVKKELFGESNPLGEKIKIKKHTFEVIGVLKERGMVAFQDYDDQILIPIRTMQKLIAGVNYLGLIRAKIDKEENVPRAIKDIEATLRAQHRIRDPSGDSDDFTVRSAAQILEIITTITDSLKFFLAAMAAIALIVGGIGIMNIMLISVAERTREIGLRKAVGANNWHILTQFITESMIITSIGGILGIGLGVLVSYLVNVAILALGYSWKFLISPLAIGLALLIAFLVGLLFGLYPAFKASRLQPIEALRYE
ncbi:FtsX-like permease family protein, partial [Candidatus Parcubacteria bacterium]